ncbi:Glycosyl transferase group 1 [Acidithiobacillus ferrivorans]|uniref:Glycosyl transferase group 1 n=2 Tax=Acidithiobacillus ferrivorans TaxID=160808 RepID=A0A060UYN6_9PROT|nr:Glycosyl transferase group 1 [Acidithiobacillus ferrivorans]SMH66124.1 Glycosyl transferase group 1 [Acidithiobacillus ferrivorans]
MTIIGQIFRSALGNQGFVAFARAALRPFPKIEHHARMLNYRLKRIGRAQSYQPALQVNLVNPSNELEKTIFFDVSELASRDVHTGIQRVVWSILSAIATLTLDQHSPVLVRADIRDRIIYAERLFGKGFSSNNSIDPEGIIKIAPGDLFFSADLRLTFPFSSLQELHSNGLRVIFTIYDLFGLTLSDMLPESYQRSFMDWFTGVLATADAIVCDSRAVADEVHAWLQNHSGARTTPLPIGYFHLGANLEASKPTEGVNANEAMLLTQLREQPTLLMVGTVEPRKGHAPALDALEMLWKAGTDINLVIVGKEGWRSHDLVRRLRRHPQRNKQLFWLEKASDALLMQLYAQSTALLAASFAEGFGLPLIEAAHYGLPVIARDIPVFHEVAGDFAFYFPNSDSAALADSLRHWLQLHASGQAPRSADMPYLTWAQSTQQLLKVILEDHWYTTYQPADARETPSAK